MSLTLPSKRKQFYVDHLSKMLNDTMGVDDFDFKQLGRLNKPTLKGLLQALVYITKNDIPEEIQEFQLRFRRDNEEKPFCKYSIHQGKKRVTRRCTASDNVDSGEACYVDRNTDRCRVNRHHLPSYS